MKNQRFFIDELVRLANIGAKTLTASAQSSQAWLFHKVSMTDLELLKLHTEECPKYGHSS